MILCDISDISHDFLMYHLYQIKKIGVISGIDIYQDIKLKA